MTSKQIIFAASGVALGYLAFRLFASEKKSNFLGLTRRKGRAGNPVWLSGNTQLACNCGQTIGGSLDVDSNTPSSTIYDFRQKCLNGGFCGGASGTVQVIRRNNQLR
jgi:hypothetical protein